MFMNECYCDDGDRPIFYRKRDVQRARAVHTCLECNRAILPGESYEQVHAMWDRHEGPRTVHTCAWCMYLREWIEAHVPCFCFMHGGLHELVGEELDNNYEARDALKPEIEAMLTEIRERPRASELLK